MRISQKRKSGTYGKVERWRERHERDGWTYYNLGVNPQPAIKMECTISEYLFNLPWNEGIRALPPYERHTGTGWENPFAEKKSVGKGKGILETYLNNQFKRGKWGQTVQDEFDKLMK